MFDENVESTIPKHNFKNIPIDILKALVDSTFRIVYKDQMLLTFEHLQPAMAEEIKKTVLEMYKQVGAEIMLKS